ncbi:cell wall-binding repeat-containing protein [Clostridium paridis]|uniref:Cell wall-binding repeat-containing protein n=1 Tax=Clostridium paridis TaxID=2803863 RepID=A0A937FIC3_9CLOT|nr:cell wall-binding repeat-containing protein [Clostridium paridis]MBL4932643.1 cell wall-binding repeat-containing protein [Clostridium paridis]
MRKITIIIVGTLMFTIINNFNVSAMTSVNMVRYGGANRYETAVEVSKGGWSQAENVVLAYSNGFADALTGVPFAYIKDAPILLTDKESIPPATLDEIKRLKAKNIYLLGSNGVISDNIQKGLIAKGYNVTRIGGKDRFETSMNISNEVLKYNKKVAILTTAYDFPDALSISSYAAINNYPILYTETQRLNTRTKEYIKNKNITKIIIPGGPSVVSDSIVNELKTLGITSERIAGVDRYSTSLNVAKTYKNVLNKGVILATGSDFPDALSGGVLAAKRKESILLVERKNIKNEVANFIKESGNTTLYVLGSTGVISNAIKYNLVPANLIVEKLYAADTSSQIITITAPSTNGFRANANYYEKQDGVWKLVYKDMPAVTGENGLMYNRKQNTNTSPIGDFGFVFAFGYSNNPGVKYNYRNIDSESYWVTDMNNTYYNRWVEGYRGWELDGAEHLINYKQQYNYAMAIDFNYYNPVRGDGAAIFLHVSPKSGGGTGGCVGLSEPNLLNVMKRLDPSKNPRIIICPEGDLLNY